MVNNLNNFVLTAQDDDFTSSDSGLGKVEGLKGNDQIILTGQYASQIDGDQGNDTLSGADLIYGGAGDDEINNAQVAYGLSGDDTFGRDVQFAYGGGGNDDFSLVEGSYAEQGEGQGTFLFENTGVQHDNSGYAIIDPSASGNNSADYLLRFDVSILDSSNQVNFSAVRILDGETNEPTKHLLISTALDYDIIVVDYFLSETDDNPAGIVFGDFILSDPYEFQVDAFSSSTLTGAPVVLPISDILPPMMEDGNTSPIGQDDTLAGTAQDDYLEGFDGDDRLFGFAGDDRLEGDAGDDRVFGGVGDDVMFGGAGDNRLDGGAGDDVIYARGETDTVWGDKGSDVIYAYADQTIISLEGIGDYAAEDEVDTVHGFDLGTDKVVITDLDFDAAGAASYLADNASIEGADLVLDLGDGRSIKMIDIVEDEDNQTEGDFAEIFVF